MQFFENNHTNKFIINKAISKCRDSFRVSQEDKEILKNYNLLDIYNFINSESSQDIVNMFNHYYAGNE